MSFSEALTPKLLCKVRDVSVYSVWGIVICTGDWGMQDIGPVSDSSLYLLWCGSVVSETGVQYLCTRELPHVCAVSCIAQYGSILGYSSQDSSQGEESECSSAWITSWLAVWLIFLLKYFPQERLWNVTAKWVQEASSCNQMLYSSPAPLEEVIHILAFSISPPSPCLLIYFLPSRFQCAKYNFIFETWFGSFPV